MQQSHGAFLISSTLASVSQSKILANEIGDTGALELVEVGREVSPAIEIAALHPT